MRAESSTLGKWETYQQNQSMALENAMKGKQELIILYTCCKSKHEKDGRQCEADGR